MAEEGENHPRPPVLKVVVPPVREVSRHLSLEARDRIKKRMDRTRRPVLSRRLALLGAATLGAGAVLGALGKKELEKWNREFHAVKIAETKKTLANYRTGYVCEGEIVVPKSVTIRTSTDAPAAGLGNIPYGGGAGQHEPVGLPGNVFLVEGDDIEPGAADGKLWVVWVGDDFALRFASLHAINTASDLRESGGRPIDPTKLTFGTLKRTADGGFQLVNPERGTIPLNLPNLD